MTVGDAIEELSGPTPRFHRLVHVCSTLFGPPRIRGSHHFFKVPWQGQPLVNLQPGKGGMAKSYQVVQVLKALRRLEALSTKEAEDDTE